MCLWIDIPNLTEKDTNYGKGSFVFTADLQAKSSSWFFSLSIDADGLRSFIIHHSKFNLITDEIQSLEQYYIKPTQHVNEIPHSIQQLYFCGYDPDNMNRLVLSSGDGFNNLTDIMISNDCVKSIREFIIDGLESLESVKIGENCFGIGNKERDDGICRITNCPNLCQLEIGDESFRDFKSFEISNLNSLQSIEFGGGCFQYADLSLKGEWKEMKEMWFEWKWKWCFRSSFIRNCYF